MARSKPLDPHTLRWCARQMAVHAKTLVRLANDPQCASADAACLWTGIASSNRRVARLFRSEAKRLESKHKRGGR